jgi:hypothetical protein
VRESPGAGATPAPILDEQQIMIKSSRMGAGVAPAPGGLAHLAGRLDNVAGQALREYGAN